MFKSNVNPMFRSKFAEDIFNQKYAHEGAETWATLARTLVTDVCGGCLTKDEQDTLTKYITELKFIPGGRYLYYAGRTAKFFNNCFLLRAEEDTREDWADLSWKSESCLMTGGGIGIDYSVYRPKGSPLGRTGGLASGPLPKMEMINEIGRRVMQGGSRRSAIYASLNWQHGDIEDFLTIKDWKRYKVPGTDLTLFDLKQLDFNWPAPLDMTNISVNYDTAWLLNYWKTGDVGEVFKKNVAEALKTAEPGFSFNFFDKERETLRNACTEVTSEDDSDVCNLGSINMGRVENIAEFQDIVALATKFLLAGTKKADLPYDRVYKVRDKNRRLGLGLMGMHEWLIQRGSRYEVTPELHRWLMVYKAVSDKVAFDTADRWGINRPVGRRAIAPTGCQREDTLIVTEDGILELNELGDVNGELWQDLNVKVAQEHGEQLATRFFANGPAATKVIKLSSGAELEATLNHQYRVIRDSEYVWVRSDELSVGDKLVVRLGGYNKAESRGIMAVPRIYRTENTPKLPTEVSDDLAWFLGLFYADGSIHEKGIRIACNAKEDDWKRVVEVGFGLFGIDPTVENNGRNCMSVNFNNTHLLRWLNINGWYKPECKDMHLPASIRTFSRQHLSSFIEGYFFGDGSTSASARYIDTVSRKYALQLQAIIRALGQDAAIRTNQSGFGSTMYRVIYVQTKRRSETADDTRTLTRLGLTTCTLDDVIEVSDGYCMTADIEVPATTTYIANGVVSHNTIGILAGTTTGVEPLFAVAYKRRYLKDGTDWHYQYVVDSAAQELIDFYGADPEKIESALDLAADYERRMAFQADVQDYVDQSISSTINLPAYGTELNNDWTVDGFANTLAKYAHRLRGFTVYPDGARGGQPLTAVPYTEAKEKLGQVFVETHDICSISGKGGTCGI